MDINRISSIPFPREEKIRKDFIGEEHTSGGSQVTRPLDTSSQFIFKQVPPDSD